MRHSSREHHDGPCGCSHAVKHPVDILGEEHQIVLAVLDAVRVAAAGRRQAPLRFWSDVIAFAEHFVDRCHHVKEEELLFPAMVAHGFPEAPGPLAVLREEHAAGRSRILAMRAALAREDLPLLARLAGEWASELEDHISKENHVLFVLARQLLSPDAAHGLAQRMARLEHEQLGDETHCRFVELARELCREQGVEFARARAPGPIGACGTGRAGHEPC